MKPAFCVPFALLTLLTAANLLAADLNGAWKASLINPGDPWQPASPVPFQPVLEFNVTDTTITGTVHLGTWLGDAEISEGKLDGDTLSFTTVADTRSTSGKISFRWIGIFRNGQLDLTMYWPNRSGWLRMVALRSE